MRRISRIIVFLSISIFAVSGHANDLGAHIKALIHEAAFTGAQWGICICSLTDDSLVFSHNDDKLFAPGSTIKLITSAAALDRLSPNYRFETEFIARGMLDSVGMLWGDLIVRGNGDPMLRDIDGGQNISRAFLQIADSLRRSGLRQIRGRLVGDARNWQREPPCASWEIGDLGEDWMPVPGALSLSRSDSKLDTTRFVVLEAMPDSAVALGPSPTIDFLATFNKTLHHAGIAVLGNGTDDENLSEYSVLYVHHSPPLSEILKQLNKESDNFIAEQLSRVLGGGNSSKGIQATREFLCTAGVDTSRIKLADGSGLSRKNLVSPSAVVQLLRYMHRHSFSSAFKQSLAVMGKDGTLAERPLKTSDAEVRAKTGTLDYASALSGYLKTSEGTEFAFSILCNNFLAPVEAVHQVQDSICSLAAINASMPSSGRVENPARRKGN